MFVKSLFLDHGNRKRFTSLSHGILDFHDELIRTTRKVCINDRSQIASLNRHAFSVESVQIIGYQGIRQGIVKYITVNGKSLCIGRDHKFPVLIGIYPLAVSFHKRNRLLNILNILERSINIDSDYAAVSGKI